MRIPPSKLTEEEAEQLCVRINLVAQGKPRLAETLELECDPKDVPLAQKLFNELLNGQLVISYSARKEVLVCPPEHLDVFSKVELMPSETPDLRIYYHDDKEDRMKGPVSLETFERQLPELVVENTSIWHEGTDRWVSLSEIKDKLLKD
jgi:hypothetical protein